MANDCGMYQYSDPYVDRYYIPFKECKSKVSVCVQQFMKNGYALRVEKDGDEPNYVLFNIKNNTDGIRKIEACREILYDLLHNICGVHYFTEMSGAEYSNNPSYQGAIDVALFYAKKFRNQAGGWSIALVINENKNFEFVEVLNAFE